MSVLDQGNSKGGDWSAYYARLRGDAKPKPTIYVKRNAEGLWDSYTRKGWYKKKRFTTGSKTPYEAKIRHKEKLKLLEKFRWNKKALKKRA